MNWRAKFPPDSFLNGKCLELFVILSLREITILDFGSLLLATEIDVQLTVIVISMKPKVGKKNQPIS